MHRLSKHFKTYKDEDNSDPLLKIFKLVDCSLQKKKQRKEKMRIKDQPWLYLAILILILLIVISYIVIYRLLQ